VYKNRYPDARFIAPAEAKAELDAKLGSGVIDESTEDFFATRKDLNISVIKAPLKAFHGMILVLLRELD